MRLRTLLLCGLVALATGCGNSNTSTTTTQTPSDNNQSNTASNSEGFYKGPELDALTSNPNRLVVMETKLGTIKLQLFDKAAPKHVANMVKLVKSGFYDGVTFHRIISGFMIQGGDPNSKDDDLSNDGIGRQDLERVPAEFSQTLTHQRGILSAARTPDPNSASTQFFIMHKHNPQLDRQYSIYGQVVEGLAVVDKIVALPKVSGDNPGKAAQILKVTITE
jgi:peptidyl-prolyl cis-trans isomerase B (cyclophilin B)